jgi:hypothetical protein
MFTLGAFILVALIGWYVNGKNEEDRPTYDNAALDDRIWVLVLHARQDLKLIAFFQGAIIIMLGILADRLH